MYSVTDTLRENMMFCKECGVEMTTSNSNACNLRINIRRCRNCDRMIARAWHAANPQKSVFNKKRNRAKEEGIPFDLSFEETVFPDVCPVLGIPIDYTRGLGPGPSDVSPSFDRIDNTKGYVRGNVIVVSNLANKIKSSASPNQILAVGQFYKNLEGGKNGGSS